ncbi:uracil-DNA glycosylase [Weissella kandleri]|uniref:uracil-DNA glycosylase n=1 Tax=Weissella kandleri TaxID=1616 RepID=UPI00387EB9B0
MDNLQTLRNTDWWKPLDMLLNTDDWQRINHLITESYQNGVVYPPITQIFRALTLTPLAQTHVVLLGQDPYPNPHQATGLSFSVPAGQSLPPSLRNIFQELAQDQGTPLRTNGDLTDWAQQGVLLLNTVLTVPAGVRNGHAKQGWEKLTDAVITILGRQKRPIVYLLWGKPAQAKAALIENTQQLILTAPHPSPLAAYRGFFGSQPFSQTNHYLNQQAVSMINWG